MSTAATLLIVIGALVIALGVFYGFSIVLSKVSSRIDSQRDARPNPQISAWASANGWAYRPEAPELVGRWAGQPFVTSNYRQSGIKAVQVIDGTSPCGRAFCSFTFRYTKATINKYVKDNHRLWVVALRLSTTLPALSIYQRGFGNHIAHASDHTLFATGYQPFDQRYQVETADQGFAATVLQPQTNLWLLGPGQSIVPFRIVGQDLLCWHSGEAPNGTPALAAQLAALDELAAALPH